MPNSFKVFCLIITGVLIFNSCSKEIETINYLGINEVPKGFPIVPEPTENTYSKSRWELGRKLFFDKRLSLDSSTSCASCHNQEFAFSDNVSKSKGFNGIIGRSNVPTLSNIAWHPYFTRAGGVPTLEKQILVPIQEHDEFNFNMVELLERLRTNSEYNSLAQEAYGQPFNAFTLTRAIACYERSFISGNSPFDLYAYQKIGNALTLSAQKGMKLFFSNKTNCSLCHSGFNFTNYSFQNNGLYEMYADSGRMKLTHLESDRAMFKVPTLRNIAYTAPYMHDGSIYTLEEVVEHYNNGGSSFRNKSELVKPLGLTESEKRDLVNFLHSLSDEQFINNPNFKLP